MIFLKIPANFLFYIQFCQIILKIFDAEGYAKV